MLLLPFSIVGSVESWRKYPLLRTDGKVILSWSSYSCSIVCFFKVQEEFSGSLLIAEKQSMASEQLSIILIHYRGEIMYLCLTLT